MRPYLLLAGAALVVAGVGVSGCRMPGAPSAQTRYWVLEPVSGSSVESEISLFLGVGPFEFPAYLERSEMVTRVGASELRVLQRDNWGQDLDRNFKQTLARNLEILVPGSAAVVFPWKGPAQVHVRIAGVVTRFEVVDERVARLEARWVATRSEDGRVVARGAWVGEEPLDGEGVAVGVAAMSRVLGALSREIAKPLAP